MQPTLAVVQRILNSQTARYGKVVDALPEEALNWRPGNEETNSVAQLIRHVTAVQEMLFGRALGGDPAYDHASGLRNDPATKEELHDLITSANTRKDDYLAQLDGMDLGAVLQKPGPVPRAWPVIHAAEHSQEHLGHAELTKQLWEQRGERP